MLESAAKGLSHPRRHSCRTPKDCGKLEDDKCIRSPPPPPPHTTASFSSPFGTMLLKGFLQKFLLLLCYFFHAPPPPSSPLVVPSPAQVNPPTSLLDPPLCFLSTSFKLWSRTDGRTCSWPKIHLSSGSRLNMAELPPIGDGGDRRWPTGRAGGWWGGWQGSGGVGGSIRAEETQTETWSPSVTFNISSLTSSINMVAGDASVWQRFIRWRRSGFSSRLQSQQESHSRLCCLVSVYTVYYIWSQNVRIKCDVWQWIRIQSSDWHLELQQTLCLLVESTNFYSFIFHAFSTIHSWNN